MKRLFTVSSTLPPSGQSDRDMATRVGLQPSLVLPPIPHPHPYEHIAIIATDDGLVMHPHTSFGHPTYVRISWGKHPKVQELQCDGSGPFPRKPTSVVVYGIVGILELFNASYLLVITARSHVGCLFDDDHSIYTVKSVHAIPLMKDRAERVLDTISTLNSSEAHLFDGVHDPTLVSQTEESACSARVKPTDENDVKVTRPTVGAAGDDRTSETSIPTPGKSSADTNVVKVIAGRMSFWTRLSRRQPTSTHCPATSSDDQQSSDSSSIIQVERTAIIDSIIASAAVPPGSTEEQHIELEDRVVRESIREYVKGCMYFAYQFDITRSLQNKNEQFRRSHTEENSLGHNSIPLDPSVEPSGLKVDALIEPFSTLPLWRRVNREFWWNEWLSKPFIDAGLHSYVLPIVQGHFQVSSFDLPKQPRMSDHDVASPVDYLVASRRSRNRAGLRYQRRGIDEEAHVANFVETETVMRIKRGGITNVFSFIQIRGSVPLYWTQSGYSMKPPPVLLPERTPEQNMDAMRRHFQRAIAIYGPLTIVNLAEQTGKESTLTNAYELYVKRMENKDIRYCGYDFHHETKGMKYENISKLINDLERTFESQGYFWNSDRILLSKQKSVFRINCIDCLDRTNVIQSAFARHILGRQLEAVGITTELQGGRSGVDIVFNDVWANNGDAISRAYTGTSALKGDFTRTGRRDLGGLLNDGINSLARMYSATFTVIDFMLGYRTITVFSEFLLKLRSTDPRELIRLSRARAEAIATSVSLVLDEGEPLLAGWTLIAPEQLNVKISHMFEEKVLLLSARALYIVRYDYTLDKVKLYTTVPLGAITNITKGAYILSPLEETSRDSTQNAGFAVTWLNAGLVSSQTLGSPDRNSLLDAGSPDNPGSPGTDVHAESTSGDAGSVGNRLLRMMYTRTASKPMVSDDRAEPSGTTFAAFKALPVGSAQVRNGSRYTEAADDLASATSCKEAVDLIVDTIKKACEDFGGRSGDDFICEGDIVSVLEAQRTTSIYAKMEHGVKRLLWLGG